MTIPTSKRTGQPPLIDLHCHLLPGIDDGAKDLDVSLKLLRMERSSGVQALMLTPHFYYERIELRRFAEQREEAYRQMTRAAAEKGVEIGTKVGAEVFFSTALPHLDLSVLAFNGGPYLLIELPTTHHPGGIEETLYEIQQEGYIPILAHVERYPYVTEDPRLLYHWVRAGCLAQINAAGLIRGGKTAQLLRHYIRWNLVHLLCSDAHSPGHRPPNLREGFDALDAETARYFRNNAKAVYAGEEPDLPEPVEPKKRLWQWV